MRRERTEVVITDEEIPDIQVDCVGMTICPRCAVTVDLSAVTAFESAHCHACNTRFVAPGKMGQYILLKQLRRDEAGATYRGFDTAMSRHVQVNVMRRSLRQDDDAVESFLAEARALALLDSRNTPSMSPLTTCPPSGVNATAFTSTLPSTS